MHAMAKQLPVILLAALGIPAGAAARPHFPPRLVPPASATCISSPFGPRVLVDHPAAGSYHYGVDLPAPVGSGVYAAAAGTVVRAQHNGPGGVELLIQHDGFVGVYSHFELIMPDVAAPGRRIAAGEQLGFVGDTGVSLGPHLYFAMILDGKPVDPAPYLRLPFCRGTAMPKMTAERRDNGAGAIVGRRKYYQLLLPQGAYYDWQRN